MTTFNDLKTKLKNLTRRWYYFKEETDEMIEDMKQTFSSSLNSMYEFMYNTFESKSNKTTSWTSPTDTKYPSAKLVKDSLDDKISKSSITGLVKNDGTIDTTTYSTFSGSYTDLSNKPSIPSSSSDLSDGSSLIKTSNTTGLVKNDGSIDTNSYSTFSGNYNDLSNKPSIPSSSSDLSDGSSLVKTSSTTGLLKNDGSVMTSGTGSSNWATGNHTHSGMLTSSDIADNLTTNDATKVLSAKQGKILYDLITSIEEDMLL